MDVSRQQYATNTRLLSVAFSWSCVYNLYLGQARRQDSAARVGQKPGGAKNQKGGHILKILYWMYAATRRPNVK